MLLEQTLFLKPNVFRRRPEPLPKRAPFTAADQLDRFGLMARVDARDLLSEVVEQSIGVAVGALDALGLTGIIGHQTSQIIQLRAFGAQHRLALAEQRAVAACHVRSRAGLQLEYPRRPSVQLPLHVE